jgi:hypothetical protein
MPIVFMLLGLLGYMICIALLKKPISLTEVRQLASRENLEVSSGNRMRCEIYGYSLHCGYSHITGEEDRHLFRTAFRKGVLMAAFKDGKLLWWSDGKTTYKPGDDIDPCHQNAVWLLESILGTIQNIVATKAGLGAQVV